MADVIDINAARSPLQYALRYAAIGWHVLPLYTGTKQPHGRLVHNGFLSATTAPDLIRQWWTTCPAAGIGIAMKPSGLVGVDIDPRNGGLETIERLEAEHGPLTSDVLAFTGGGGEHRVFHSTLVENLPGKLGPGVDLKADGYIAVEPSIHPSGRPYCWEASSDPLEGVVPSTLPGWVRDLARRHDAAPMMAASRLVDRQQLEELRDALRFLPSDDYHQWVNTGNALVELGADGFALWDEWSAKSSKYIPQGMLGKWRSFRSGTRNLESIFWDAQQAGWPNPMAGSALPPALPKAVPVEQVRVKSNPNSPPTTAPVEDDFADMPGILGTVARWVHATSRKPQPAFARQTAIAFVAAVTGRRYRSSAGNWPSIYLLNIGKSASGKEHAKWALERLLDACDLAHLVGPAGYTSSAGVLSALLEQPAHVAVLDELGKSLEDASVKANSRARSAFVALMEVWGRADGVLRPQGYSTTGMSSRDAQAMKDRQVHNPALTLLTMTTPDAFFESIGSAAARDGFLNRFLIVESDIGRQVGRMPPELPVPDEVVAWAQAMRAPGGAQLVDPDRQATLKATPQQVPIANEAQEVFGHFAQECVDLMDANDGCGLAEMFGRTHEMAMRLALIAALACEDEVVAGPHAAWAVQYVRPHALHIVERLKTSVADSEVEAQKKQVLMMIRSAGALGMTERDLNKSSRRFRGLLQRQQVELLNSLQFVGDIQRVEIARTSGGKPRTAWVAVAEDDVSDD